MERIWQDRRKISVKLIPHMKTIVRRYHAVVVTSLLCWSAPGQPFVGTNAPNTASNFTVTLPAGSTNFSLVVSNSAAAYSYLSIKFGGTPTDSDFDFISRLNGRTNRINLQTPEFMAGTYGLRVRTPSSSATQAFSVVVTTNRTDVRSAAYPVLKPHVFSTTGRLTNTPVSGTWHYFQIDIPTNLPGCRIVLSTNNGSTANPDLFVQRGQLPTQSSYLKSSLNQNIDTIVLTDTEATNFTYFIGVFLPSTAAGPADYTLSTEVGYLQQLAWDSGTAHEGTQVYTNQSLTGGDYFFRITTQNPSVGAWRTALYVDAGEADVSIRSLSFSENPANYTYRQSARVGADGWVLHSSEFAPAQDWYLVVHATPGAQWRLFSGDVFVTNLGTLAADSSSSSGALPMGAEGMRFFRTTTTVSTLAWRLWLDGGNNPLLVRQTAVPHPRNTGTYDWYAAGQMLLVPSYLIGGQSYFVGVIGNPGEIINLDSRQHGYTDLAFNSTTNIMITGYGYTTFRVQVPVQQIAWLTTVVPGSGNANVAVRRDFIPNEFFNGGFSEVPGLTADSVTLVPPTLSDGTFYVTVYGIGPYSCTLFSGNPTMTDVAFVSTTLNTDLNRVGWRYFRVPDIASQLGTLGWDLLLSNYVAGTELAIRQNAVPSRWNFRNGSSNVSSSAHIDFTGGTSGFLQRPGHQADIWYVGAYNPSNALGPFTLILRELSASLTDFDGGSITRTAAAPGRWEYFRVDVPANALGWDVRLVNVAENGALPTLVVRRDQLPDALTTGPWSIPQNVTNWPSGYRWRASSDWTARSFSPSGAVNEDGRILAMGMGRPLEPGTYYVGVNNQSGIPMTFTVQSRGIGNGFIIPVSALTFAGGSVTNTLPPREAGYYAVDVPPNTPAWKVKMRAVAGESLLIALKDVLPSVAANIGVTGPNDSGLKMQKLDNEHFALLPLNNQSNVAADRYYLAVVSEGINVTNNSRIGIGGSTYELTSQGVLPVGYLGALTGPDLTSPGSLEGGELAAYQFDVPVGTLAMEVRLDDRTGNPALALVATNLLPQPNSASYGTEGGQTTGRLIDDRLINVANPVSGRWSLTAKANLLGNAYPAATYTVRVHRLSATDTTLAFDGGMAVVTNQEAGTWRYFRVDVPGNAFGWDLRLIDVSTNSLPRFSIRRDLAPASLSTTPWSSPGSSLNWPTGYQWAASLDWSDRQFNADGRIDETGRILAMGMGRPLEPGTYYVGVINNSGTNAMAYTLFSRGIGTNMTIPVIPLDFNGGSFTTNSQPVREAAYYCINVPSNTPSWKLRLATNASESLLIVLRGVLPNARSSGAGAFGVNDAGIKLQKAGNEHYALFPQAGQTNIPAGTYYLAVAAEGMNTTNNSRIGFGSSGYTIESHGPLTVLNLGVLTPVDILQPGTLEGGEVAAYQFTVPTGTLSMEVRLENRTGNPGMALRPGDRFISPNSPTYGGEGGETSLRITDDSLITVANPSNGVYTLIVKANATGGFFSNATYTVRISAVTPAPVAFDGGSVSVTNHPSGTWRYYRVDVPADTNVLGWDIRLADVPSNGGTPRLVIRREQLPSSLATTPWSNPQSSLTWPTGYQWAATADWTQRQFSPNGQQDESSRILSIGIGRPLEPGTYFIGVINASGTSNMTYRVQSRGIGNGLSIPVTPIAFGGGSVTNLALPPREAAYYSVVVPSNSPSWKIRLGAGSGDSVLLALRGAIPSCIANNDASRDTSAGQRMDKDGNEHYVLLPVSPQTNVPGGTYYLAVASEGMNLTNNSRIGVGTSSFTISSQGSLPIGNLGAVGGAVLVSPGALEGGEVAAYQFTVPPGTPAIEARLNNRVGNPVFALRLGAELPYPTTGYGVEGGYSQGRLSDDTLVTVASPSNGVYSIAVQADNVSSTCPDATFTLNVRHIPILDLSFAPNFNGPAQTNVVGQLLADDQRAFYRVVVPAMNNGHAVTGWRLVLTQISGRADLRVRRDFLPTDSASTFQSPFGQGDYVIVPPYLTPGIWYVEVRGTGSTEFMLVSDELLLERPPWDMPQAGQPTTTPGLTAPDFGDSGVDVSGNPLPGDQGIDLELNFFHYYAVNVPTNNGGVLRVVLEAINGNPDFYLRTVVPPTLSHGAAGPISGTPLYDRALTDITTEYASWVTANGRYERELTNGLYYIAIRAVTSNVRYRLRLSTGNIQDLALDGGTFNNQIMAAGDWRYYRVQIPTNAPRNWQVSFNQILGDVVLYVRDTIPPGQGSRVTDYLDWQDDNKNHGPYPSYDPAGLNTIVCPPLRPGHRYYLGFRAVNDATFSVSSAISGGAIDVTNVVAFYGGFTNTTISPNSVLRFRVDVPIGARRWTHYETNTSAVWLHLDQGSLPTLTLADHFNSRSGTNSFTRDLYTPNSWPWHAGYMYFITVTNTSAAPQYFAFRMDGRDCATDDFDNDQLPDCWELTYWPNIATYSTFQDPDMDGIPNLVEYQNGTNPTVNDSGFYFTNSIALPNGSLQTLFVGPQNGSYRWQAAPTVTGVWSQLRSFTNSGGMTLLIDTNASAFTNRFYRAVTP
jgi:hypothetical protein